MQGELVMKFKPYESSKNIVHYYKRYLLTTFSTNSPERNNKLKQALDSEEMISKGPYICLSDSFKKASTIPSLIKEGLLVPEMNEIDPLHGLDRRLFKHQEDALRAYNKGQNLIVTTGTGSGKTITFMLPIINSLLKEERTNGQLGPGVRVLIIYPMNALVNDQINEWETILSGKSNITIGQYTSNTPHRTSCDTDEHGNIITFRETMEERPPHILITNYSMLERLLLVPRATNLFKCFSDNCWKTVVLDEAHTYKGSLGIEISSLLRRLKARVGRDHFRFILTSATLGDDNQNEAIINFGRKLCSEEFSKDSIIRATFYPPQLPCERKNVDISIYQELAKMIREDRYEDICRYLQIDPIKTGNNDNDSAENVNRISEPLYDLIIKDSRYASIRDILFDANGKGIVEKVDVVADKLGFKEKDDFTDFITVASLASKNGYGLFDAKYHMFIKGIEGVFVSLPPSNLISLKKATKLTDENGTQFNAYEVSFCSNCCALFIPGQFILRDERQHLEQLSPTDANYNPSIYLLDENEDDAVNKNWKTIKVCAICGAKNSTCNCDERYTHNLIEVKANSTVLHKCPCCGAINTQRNLLRPYYVGSEAASYVLSTALYSQLPCTTEKKQTIDTPSSGTIDFGAEINDSETENDISETENSSGMLKRQFLAFSDNRQKAASFAYNMDNSYKDTLVKRLMFLVYEENQQSMLTGLDVTEFARKLANKFEQLGLFYKKPEDGLHYDPLIYTDLLDIAYYYILRQITNSKAKNSLMNKGGLYFYIDDKRIPQDRDRSLFQILCQELMKKGYVGDKEHLGIKKDDYERDLPDSGALGGLRKNQIEGNNQDTRYLIPAEGNSSTFCNLFVKLLGDNQLARRVLHNIWDYMVRQGILIEVSNNRNQINILDNSRKYILNLEKIKIKKESILFRCPRCLKLTPVHIDNICPTANCQEKLVRINPEEVFRDDHYFRLYRDFDPVPMVIEEHTAQISPEEAKWYQDEFSNNQGKVNVLSCSTTFEMGVNVGSLQTVFMRNIPPTPANYVQRSGRAGRSSESASYTITYCPNSPHDQYYYRFPEKMISGSIMPPDFDISNQEIIFRHLFASALSLFWNKNNYYYLDVDVPFQFNNPVPRSQIGSFFENGWTQFQKYLESNPTELKDYLLKAFPENVIDPRIIENFEWLPYFFGTRNDNIGGEGVADKVFKQYSDEINMLERRREEFRRKLDDERAAKIGHTIDARKRQNVISFLSRYALLPKYGFPTDIVSLDGTSRDVELSRSLSMAIFDYAPGNKIVANKKTYISRYIKKPTGYPQWKERFFRRCQHCDAIIQENTCELCNSITQCSQCGQPLDGEISKYIIPEYGFFIGDPTNEENTANDTSTIPKKRITSYIGNDRGNPPQKYECEEHTISVARSKNDELAILNADKYVVCSCGYCIPYKNQKKLPEHDLMRLGNEEKEKCKKSNQQIEDKYIYSLGYELVTDIAIIDFPTLAFEGNTLKEQLNQAWTVLYAILEGLSKTLNIERTDISGCLKRSQNSFGLVLFDTAPGGAGIVKKLYDQADVLRSTLQSAYDVVKNCSCSEDTACYGCLCNYYNQMHHRILKRSLAIRFLEHFINPNDPTEIAKIEPIVNNSIKNCVVEPIENDPSKQSTINNSSKNVIIDSFEVDCSNHNGWQTVIYNLADYAESEEDKRIIIDNYSMHIDDLSRKEKPVIGGSLSLGEIKGLPFTAAWEKSQVILFNSSEQPSYEAIKQSTWTGLMISQPNSCETLIKQLKEE